MKTTAFRTDGGEVRGVATRGLYRVGRGMAGAFWRWHRRRMALRELSSIDPHTLDDLGLDRSKVNAIVLGGCPCRRAHGIAERARPAEDEIG